MPKTSKEQFVGKARKERVSSSYYYLTLCKEIVRFVIFTVIAFACAIAGIFIIGLFFNFMMSKPIHVAIGFLILTIGIVFAALGYYSYYRE